MTDTDCDILSDEDATLLLYIANELGDTQRQAIDARLTTDAGLRDRLDQLTQFDAQMRAETAIRAVPAADSRHALNATLHLVREQAIVLQQRPTMRMGGRRLAGIPRWAWGSAVAACLAVGFVVWITNSEPTPLAATVGNVMGDEDSIQTRRSEVAAMAAAFGTIEPAGSEGPATDIDAQVEALNMLAVMNELN